MRSPVKHSVCICDIEGPAAVLNVPHPLEKYHLKDSIYFLFHFYPLLNLRTDHLKNFDASNSVPRLPQPLRLTPSCFGDLN